MEKSNIELNANAYGNYSWKIQILGDDVKKIPKEIKEVDELMEKEFGIRQVTRKKAKTETKKNGE